MLKHGTILILIILAVTLTAYQTEQIPPLKSFAEKQSDTYKIVEKRFFRDMIKHSKLHSKSEEIALKSKTSHSNHSSYDLTVYARIQLYLFDFDTKEKCRNAQDSLLINQFHVKITRQVNSSAKITPGIFILNSKSIVYALTPCTQVDQKWIDFKKDFTTQFAEDNADIIISHCGGIKWSTKEKILKSQ